jgi:predicted AlkP superfamily pyrophosphatase or phosphodiesterase
MPLFSDIYGKTRKMTKRFRPALCLMAFLFASGIAFGQNSGNEVPRPKLVVGLMVDQMRWDFLYRYADRYSEDGFRRMLREGFTCENTFIPYAQTVTAAGHATVYTGTTPAIHGIMGNEWYERSLGRSVYCVEDATVKTIGGSPKAQPMSPRNMWSTSITDELRLATNFRSKVVGIAIKDRGGILPAGHSANAAYWYDAASGNWVTSTYYMDELPSWVKGFNDRRVVDSFLRMDWNTLYPIDTYRQSDADDVDYEGTSNGDKRPVFPHKLSQQAGKNYGSISGSPHGSTFTLEFAKSALIAEEMGRDAETDILAVSLSSPDYTGHQYGPNSVEIEDTYLRLDRDLENFFRFLDAKVGKGQWTLFLTADHGVAHVPGFLNKKKIPGSVLGYGRTKVEKVLTDRFGVKGLIVDTDNYQMYLNHRLIDSLKLNGEDVRRVLIDELNNDPNVLTAFDNRSIAAANLPSPVRERFLQGYNTKRAGDVQLILKPNVFAGQKTGTTHGSWYPYDSHIPLVWMGWGIRQGRTNRETYMTDIAPTLSALLRIQMPSGSIGQVIGEVVK